MPDFLTTTSLSDPVMLTIVGVFVLAISAGAYIWFASENSMWPF